MPDFFKKPEYKAPLKSEPKKETKRERTVPCPIHQTPLNILAKDGRLFAVCECKVPNNKYLNQVVWEREDTRRIL